MPAPRKITVDEAHATLAAMGLPLAVTGQAGFYAKAWGGRSGYQIVKSAAVIQISYSLGGGRNLTSGELRETPELRALFQRLVDLAPDHGYEADWNPNVSHLDITRAGN